MASVLRPLKVVLENYPEDLEDQLEAINNPEDESAGTRQVPFSRELYIEQEDFMEDPPKKFFRLAPGREVRLRVLVGEEQLHGPRLPMPTQGRRVSSKRSLVVS